MGSQSPSEEQTRGFPEREGNEVAKTERSRASREAEETRGSSHTHTRREVRLLERPER